MLIQLQVIHKNTFYFFFNISVHAAPEPCKELLDLMIKPGKIQKLKEDEKERDNKHKRKKENIRQLKKGNSYK